MARWSTQDAKARFSEAIDAAVGGEPQFIMRHGRTVAKIVAANDDEANRQRPQRLKADGTPYTFIDHLLAMPQDDGEFERIEFNASPRDLGF